MPDLPRVALIGVSGYAWTYLRLALALQAERRITLCAAVVIDPHQQGAAMALLRQHNVAVYADYEEMLDRHRGALELCLIPTGIAWHTRMTLAALAAGANVLVEKPIAGSLTEARLIRQAEQASGLFVAVGFQDLYTAEVRKLQADLAAGIIGSVTSLRLLGLWPRDKAYYTRNDWAGRLKLKDAAVFDSPLNNAFAHFVNLCLFFASAAPHRAARVLSLVAELYRIHEIESFDTAVVQATLEGHLPLWIGVSHACASAHDPEIVIEGTRGRIVWHHEGDCVLTPASGPTVVLPVQRNDDARYTMFRQVVQRLHDPTAFVCSPELAEPHADLIDKLHASAIIWSIPPEYVLTTATGRVAPGLAEALHEGFARQSSLRATGFGRNFHPPDATPR